jgi:CheY-like chemotaxis protein
LATVLLRPEQVPSVAGVTLGIYDALRLDSAERERMRRFALAVRPAPVMALVDFPRVADVEHWRAAGAAAVLSKPVNLDDLFWQLDQLLLTNLPARCA